jgi:hypothetical protein
MAPAIRWDILIRRSIIVAMNPAFAFVSSSRSLELGDLLFNLSFQIFRGIISPHATKAASSTKEPGADICDNQTFDV